MNLSKEAILEFRELRLGNLEAMLARVVELVKEAGGTSDDAILARHDLLEKQRDIKQKIEASAALDQEEIELLNYLEEELDEDEY